MCVREKERRCLGVCGWTYGCVLFDVQMCVYRVMFVLLLCVYMHMHTCNWTRGCIDI